MKYKIRWANLTVQATPELFHLRLNKLKSPLPSQLQAGATFNSGGLYKRCFTKTRCQ